MMHVWGTVRSRQLPSDYINILSLLYDDLALEAKFRDLILLLRTLPSNSSYTDLIQNNKLLNIIKVILDSFANESEVTHFSFDVISRSYLSYVSFYIDLIADDLATEDRIKVLDDIYESLDKYLVSRLTYMSNEEMSRLNSQVEILLGNTGYKPNQKFLTSILERSDSNFLSERRFSDDKMRKSVYLNWMTNHFEEVETDDNLLQVYSSVADDIEMSLWNYAEIKKIDSVNVSISSPKSSEVSNAITLFFNFLNSITVSILNRKESAQYGDNLMKIEDNVFLHLWHAFNKESSLWITPSSNYKEINKLI